MRAIFRFAFAVYLTLTMAGGAAGHDVPPGLAEMVFEADRVTVALTLPVDVLPVPRTDGIDLSQVIEEPRSPVPYAPTAPTDGDFPADPAAALRDAWPDIVRQMTLRTGETDLDPVLTGVRAPLPTDPIPQGTFIFAADLPPGDGPVVFGLGPALGSVIVRQTVDGETYGLELAAGALSDPLPRSGVAELSLGGAIARYVVSGFDHIVPKGLDHILFVLGLFFYSLRWRPLLWQVSTFTAAHTCTLALSTLGLVSLPPTLVEPLIAASIVFVALENIWSGGRDRIGWGRIAVVFGFGLLHGLGFASVLGEFGLDAHFVASLLSFNIGVELGQLAVISAAFLLLAVPFGAKPWYRARIAIPGSLIIAAIGAYWVLNRVGILPNVPYLT